MFDLVMVCKNKKKKHNKQGKRVFFDVLGPGSWWGEIFSLFLYHQQQQPPWTTCTFLRNGSRNASSNSHGP
ncbi:MAG: hypothetical protein II755_13565, partial [Prevotella sp.]|nr:hypothetical protein [Prevotella sp.]